MSWNRHPLLYSLKARTAFLYVGLFSISFAIIFIIVYLYLYFGNQDTADRRLNGIFSECEYEYLTGNDLTSSQVPVHRLKDIPAAVFQLIADKLGGLQVILAFRNAENSNLFTLLGVHDGELLQLKVDAAAGTMEDKTIKQQVRTAILARKFASESYGEGNGIYFLLLSSDNKIITRSPFSRSDLKCFTRYPYNMQASQTQYANLQGARWRIRMAYRKLFDGNLLIVGLNQHAADENLERIANAFGGTGITVLILSVVCGWVLACRMLRGIEKVGRAADKIAAGDYSLRVPASSEGLEIDELISSFNIMTDNTEKLMQELRTVTDDIAHDLRTPLTRMLGRSEVAVSGKPTLESVLDTLGDNAEDCRSMLSLINKMLDIAKTESGAGILHKKRFDLVSLIKRSVAIFHMVAEQKEQRLSVNLPDSPMEFYADPVRIQQLIANLLDNAIKFTPAGGSITVSIVAEAEEILLKVTDTGCGIAPEESSMVFKRFYRADTSRNLPGNGLGLAMVQAVARAHGGHVDFCSVVGKGSTFTVYFPKSQFVNKQK